jgi:hypothetical protein
MPVYGIVAKVGFAADEPPRKWRPAKVANLIEWLFPVDGFGLFAPKAVAIGQGTFAEFLRSKTGAHLGGWAEGYRSQELESRRSVTACGRIGVSAFFRAVSLLTR